MNKNKLKTPGNPLTISFDFSTSEQKILFQWLSDHDYKLYLYKASNVVAGVGLVPIWYSIPFTELAAGKIVISHVPTYRAYMAYTVASDVGDEIKVFTISDDVLLGTQLTLDKYGEFYETGKAPSGQIEIISHETKLVQVGLSSIVSEPSEKSKPFSPFCAVTLPPQNSVMLEPRENILIFAGQDGFNTGSIQLETTAPGVIFPYSSEDYVYPLEMIPITYGIKSSVEDGNVKATSSEANIATLLGNTL
ncbi:hypothetical protein [bacterium endosymbiont of Bathymodiolus sp. 5 South]|jgi:hypothetical protein|uniref:hypothetical protein n=1 Tax=bacterium endosymbiont of Bathymodiolus sp. 5 South TaxID=1181670 RepID=UPI0010BBF3FA|nr:hypothetical protein [bacterium endosymbiont of Bathymodiolus sp. 5 South]SSC08837.1 hypothetical protein BTURTLESOX_524 [bacterium endosymbiont of Bathymodiolus sp. 5 South]VVM19891.1 hypothetical protein BSPWISOXPB_8703 [uncultured Gammaproteobacteria bacterium]VVM20122.1 hypothetical protein BSPWISOXPB_3297 [uncultured Gammaproteobacteria bacterium]